ncbi:MAG: VanW family protein [Anaerolineaceae bacterium]|jgi:vancomycin resistance protein YoaR
MQVISRPFISTQSVIRQVFLALFFGVCVFLFVLFILSLGFQLVFIGRILPGVTVAGIDVGGMTVTDAARKINATITFPRSGHITLQDGDQTWQATPANLGLILDPNASAESAFGVGREGNLIKAMAEQFGAIYYGHPASLALIFDQRTAYQYLSGLKKQVDLPAVEANISLQGTNVVVTNGQAGRTLDVEATLAFLTPLMSSFQNSTLPLVVHETQPEVMDATAQANLARQILSQPLTLTLPDGQPDKSQLGPWVIQPTDLAAMLNFERINTNGTSASYQVTIDSEALRSYLVSLSTAVALDPQNTRFTFNDGTSQLDVIQPAVIGRVLNIDKSVATIQQQLAQGNHTIALEFDFTSPQVTDNMTGSQLGITQLIYSETTYFFGSPSARMQNIQIAASRFHGLLVPPGATFSMAQQIGDISLDNGYAEAPIIVGDRTINGVGGGVCQVSTTLFRTALYAGFPIVDRTPHAYQVMYYEQTATGQHDPKLAGMDATVFFPLVDLQFTNDTPYWLLMETYFDASGHSLTWKFYSTSDGRSVVVNASGPTNIVDPLPDVYNENPDLPKGEIKQVDWAVQGADVTVNRTVSRNGSIYFSDTYSTHYVPWPNIFEYGPGTDIPSSPSK